MCKTMKIIRRIEWRLRTRLIKEDDYIMTEWSGGKTFKYLSYPEGSKI